MLDIRTPEEMAQIPAFDVSRLSSFQVVPAPDAPGLSGDANRGCSGCAAYRPEPQRSGNLQIDPEVSLVSPGFGNDRLDIAQYYNASASNNGPFGYGRSLAPFATAQASGAANHQIVSIVRDTGAVVSYQDNGSGAFM